MKRVYLLLGSNLGNRKQYLERARYMIGKIIGSLRRSSELYETEPWGFQSSQLFLNQALEVETMLSPGEVMSAVSHIEEFLGRSRSAGGYASRTIDVDILLFDAETVDQPGLQIPHPKLHLRKFALVPLAEIAGDQKHPVLGRDIRSLLNECKDPLKVYPLPKRNSQFVYFPYRFLCIEGNIGSGKTSLATKLSEETDARLILEQFEENPFLSRFYEHPERYAFPLEMSFLADRYQQLANTLPAGDLFNSKIISDFFIDKSLIFARQTLNKDEFSLFSRMFQMLHERLSRPDLIVYLYNDPESLKKNILQRGRPYEKAISLAYLDRIQQGYLEYFRHQKELRILLLDIRKTDFVRSNAAYEHIRSSLQKNYPPGIHRILPEGS